VERRAEDREDARHQGHDPQRPRLAGAAAVGEGLGALIVVAAAALLINRPWLVVAERRGLRPPRRVWRVNGWWRSRRCLRDVIAAIAVGGLDAEPGGPTASDPGSRRYRVPGRSPTGLAIGWLELDDDNGS
jgi:hypothetical protein